MFDIKISKQKFVTDEGGLETVDIVTNNCPKCNKENSLIMLYKRDKFVGNKLAYSNAKVTCMACNWKISGAFKW